MSGKTEFLESAKAATDVAAHLLDAASRHARREQIPSLLELQTICRETGFDLSELNVFARVRDHRPALLLCGGSAELAMAVAKQMGYSLELPELPVAPLVWSVDAAAQPGLSLRHADTERPVTPRMLITFLQNDLKLTDFVFIEERLVATTEWRFVWLPRPEYLAQFEQSNARLEILLGQQAAVTVTENTPEEVIKLLHQLEQKWWPISGDPGQEEERAHLFAELSTLLDEPGETRELRAISLWQFLSERLLDDLERRKRDYIIAIDQHEHKLKSMRHTLAQYQRSWVSAVRSVTETDLQARMTGSSFMALMDPERPGPDVESFLAAVGLPSIFTKLEQLVTDRIAEFMAGLDGMASRLELRRIRLGEMKARWTPRTMGPRLENRLRERRIFTDGGGKRGGLVAKMTGRTQGILDHRRTQIINACRELPQAMSTDFAEWCTGFMMAFEQNIRVQLTAALANKGLPDTDRLRGALAGIDRLSDQIRHHRDMTRTSEDIATEWLGLLASRRWIPLYQDRTA